MESVKSRPIDDFIPVKKPRLNKSMVKETNEKPNPQTEENTPQHCAKKSSLLSSSNSVNIGSVELDKNEIPNNTKVDPEKNEESVNQNSMSDSSFEASESDWQPSTDGAFEWIHSQMVAGVQPRDILYKLVPDVAPIPPDVNMLSIWKLILSIISEPKRRKKLDTVNTLSDAIRLIKTSKKILVLTGAGVSVSCGIPDFRSRDGIYSRLSVDFPDLPNPQAMFDIHYFKHDPRPFFKFAKEIYPGQFKPSRAHRFISLLEKTGRLLRNYTQNIDTLEQVAGISKVVQCHGSFATASCCSCDYKTNCEELRADIFNQVVPHCPRCPSDDPGVIKPDIVFFGENLPQQFHRQMTSDKDDADLLIVIGSSLKVRPVALIPNSIPDHIPQLLINREPLSHMTFDIELLGDCDVILSEISKRLGGEFNELVDEMQNLTEISVLPDAAISPNTSNNTADAAISSPHTMSPLVSTVNSLGNGLEKETENVKHCGKVGRNSLESNVTSGDTFERSKSVSTCENNAVLHCDNSTDVSKSTLNETSTKTDEKNIIDSKKTTDTEKSTNDYHKYNVNDEKSTNDNQKSIEDEQTSKNNREKSTVGEKNVDSDKSTDATESTNGDKTNENKSTTDDLDQVGSMKGFWKSRWKQSISKKLPPGKFYYDSDHRYIFAGAEVSPEEESDSDSDSSDTGNTSDDDGSDMTCGPPHTTEADQSTNISADTNDMQSGCSTECADSL
nr:NAD-dependent protein deacetylase sirtuin-1-like [Ciona intestinalis]|eukprot:XP_018667757.1 NAD-dependent protein deacetylase sirtuin-1-like [Ciona intestinalis]